MTHSCYRDWEITAAFKFSALKTNLEQEGVGVISLAGSDSVIGNPSPQTQQAQNSTPKQVNIPTRPDTSSPFNTKSPFCQSECLIWLTNRQSSSGWTSFWIVQSWHRQQPADRQANDDLSIKSATSSTGLVPGLRANEAPQGPRVAAFVHLCWI